MRNRVGMVATTWMAPYPNEAYKASVGVYPTLSKIVEL